MFLLLYLYVLSFFLDYNVIILLHLSDFYEFGRFISLHVINVWYP